MALNKIAAERSQRTLLELVSQPGNDICADCKTRHPRWASYSLGIFLCVNCASIHRKMGTHISKVKSLTLDSWTKDQVEFMKTMGNAKSNAHYNPDEIRHPPPTNMIDSERDSDLEKYIRSKYEYKSFVSRSSQVASLLGPSRSASSRLASAEPHRSQTMPLSNSTTSSSSRLPTTPSLPATSTTNSRTSTNTVTPHTTLNTQPQARSVSHPVAPLLPPSAQQPPVLQPAMHQPAQMQQRSMTLPPQAQLQPQPQQQSLNPVWNDLAQLQTPAVNSSLPLQYAPTSTMQPMSISGTAATSLSVSNQFTGLSISPNNPFPSALGQQQTGMFTAGAGTTPRSISLGTGLNLAGSVNMNMNMGVGTGLGSGMSGTSPSMFQPQPTPGGLSTPSMFLQQNTTPSPNPFTPQSLPSSGLSVQQSFAPSPFGATNQPQTMLSAQPQSSPMFQSQPLGQAQVQGSPMFQPQALGQPQMGNPFLQGTPQPPQGMSPFASAQPPPFGGTPSPSPYAQPQMQQPQQQQMFGQPGMNMSTFGGTGWQQPGYMGQQQTGYPGQQQWGGM